MNLALNYEQRLYLYLLLGNLECRTVAETRSAWGLMDRLNLDQTEKTEIGFTSQLVNGCEAYSWDQSKSNLSPREYDLSYSDIQQLGRAIAACPRFVPRDAKRWLEPLLRQLPQLELEETSNGNRAGIKS